MEFLQIVVYAMLGLLVISIVRLIKSHKELKKSEEGLVDTMSNAFKAIYHRDQIMIQNDGKCLGCGKSFIHLHIAARDVLKKDKTPGFYCRHCGPKIPQGIEYDDRMFAFNYGDKVMEQGH